MDEHVNLYKRVVIGSAQETEIDKQGRILISAAQREDSGLSSDIVIVGQLDKIDLWDRKEWDAANDLSKIDKRAIAHKLAGYGL